MCRTASGLSVAQPRGPQIMRRLCAFWGGGALGCEVWLLGATAFRIDERDAAGDVRRDKCESCMTSTQNSFGWKRSSAVETTPPPSPPPLISLCFNVFGGTAELG